MTTAINLIPYYRRNARIQRVHLRQWGAACGTYCVLALAIAVILLTQTNTNAVEGLEASIADANMEVQARSERVGGLQTRVNEAARLHAATRVRYPQPDWSLLLGLFKACGSEAILLDGFEVLPRFAEEAEGNSANIHILETPPAFSVNVAGWSESQRSVTDYILTLERTELFESITITESSRQSFRTGDAIRFHIEALLNTQTPVQEKE